MAGSPGPAAVSKTLQKRVLGTDKPTTCRPADLIEPELEKLTEELKRMVKKEGVKLAKSEIDDVLSYALFPQIGFKFLQNRGNPAAFEPVPSAADAAPVAAVGDLDVTVNGRRFRVEMPGEGVLSVNGRNYKVQVDPAGTATSVAAPAAKGEGEIVKAPMAGHILRINVAEGQHVEPSAVVIVMEAMKMETEIRTRAGGIVSKLSVKVGDTVASQDNLLILE